MKTREQTRETLAKDLTMYALALYEHAPEGQAENLAIIGNALPILEWLHGGRNAVSLNDILSLSRKWEFGISSLLRKHWQAGWAYDDQAEVLEALEDIIGELEDEGERDALRRLAQLLEREWDMPTPVEVTGEMYLRLQKANLLEELRESLARSRSREAGAAGAAWGQPLICRLDENARIRITEQARRQVLEEAGGLLRGLPLDLTPPGEEARRVG